MKQKKLVEDARLALVEYNIRANKGRELDSRTLSVLDREIAHASEKELQYFIEVNNREKKRLKLNIELTDKGKVSKS